MRLNKKTLISLLLFFLLAVSACSGSYVKRKFITRPYEVDFSYESFHFFYDIFSKIEIIRNKKKVVSFHDVKNAIESFLIGFSYHSSIKKLQNLRLYLNYKAYGDRPYFYDKKIITLYTNSLEYNKIFKKIHIVSLTNTSYLGFSKNKKKLEGKKSRFSLKVSHFGLLPSVSENGNTYWNILVGYQIKDLKTKKHLLKQLRLIKIETKPKQIEFNIETKVFSFDDTDKKTDKAIISVFLNLVEEYLKR